MLFLMLLSWLRGGFGGDSGDSVRESGFGGRFDHPLSTLWALRQRDSLACTLDSSEMRRNDAPENNIWS